MADILKQKGLDVDIPDRNDERTALQWAARLGHDDITKALLDKRASIKRKDKDEKTALHWAATEGRETVVKLLLD
ncbi:ankyrin, partial [Lojkania enalia]